MNALVVGVIAPPRRARYRPLLAGLREREE